MKKREKGRKEGINNETNIQIKLQPHKKSESKYGRKKIESNLTKNQNTKKY